MLKVLKKEEIDQYLDFAWNLTQDWATSSYPTYKDGIKNKEGFVDRAKRVFESTDSELLLFTLSEIPYGWIIYFFDEDSQTVFGDTCLCKDHYKEMIIEFIAHVRNKHPYCEIGLGFPSENSGAINALMENGFVLEEKSHNHVFGMEHFVPHPYKHVRKMMKEDFPLFQKLHDSNGVDMYWTSERIKEHFDSWTIFVYEFNGKVLGTLYSMDEKILLEVFGLDYLNNEFDENVFKNLFALFLGNAQRDGVKFVVYFSDGRQETRILTSLGFTHVGEYQYFILHN